MSVENALSTIRKIFDDHKIKWVDPITATVGEIYRGKAGTCRGLYYIFPDVNFYFGMTNSDTNTICGSRFKPHYAKMKVDLRAMYGYDRPKKNPSGHFLGIGNEE